FVCNFTPVYRPNYRIGVPEAGFYREILNTDSEIYWGSNKGNYGGKHSDPISWHYRPYSIEIDLPPLATVVFKRQV
ncbi:MAG: alpha amylase C-terminal domain-containing protein, partial [candidate division KSB1 bacterium]|nr:alpha amylase C-terminal domain-containing protein [candidate division KSB1 bacterium]